MVAALEVSTIRRLSDDERRSYRLKGKVLFGFGLAVVVAAVPVTASLAFRNIEGGSFSRLMFFVPFTMLGFGGIGFIAWGRWCLQFGYVEFVAEILSSETRGAVENTSRAVGRGGARGFAGSGWSVAPVGPGDPRVPGPRPAS